ncbi:MAG: PD-(D/E)XK nuclease-like domain-containing protein [Xanthobacteraceae bacterium]
MNITQFKGGKIALPGCYSGIPIELYHGDLTEGPGVSSSGLRTIEAKSPAHYYATSYLNPDRLPEEPKDHFSFGKAAHTLLLGEDGFRDQFVTRPDEWDSWRTKASQEWKAAQIAAGRTVLNPQDVVAIRHIAKQLAADPLVQSGILQGKVEHSLIWQDKVTGVWLKSRPDVIPSADGVLVDLKTTADASPEAVVNSIKTYGYALQGALAGMGMEATLGVKMTDFVLVWIEKSAPFAVSISPVDPEWIYWARRQLRRAIDTFAKCVETNEWPGYSGEATAFMPTWLKKRFEEQAETGELPEEIAA